MRLLPAPRNTRGLPHSTCRSRYCVLTTTWLHKPTPYIPPHSLRLSLSNVPRSLTIPWTSVLDIGNSLAPSALAPMDPCNHDRVRRPWPSAADNRISRRLPIRETEEYKPVIRPCNNKQCPLGVWNIGKASIGRKEPEPADWLLQVRNWVTGPNSLPGSGRTNLRFDTRSCWQ